MDKQDELHTLYTSGTVFHAFLGEKLPDWQAAANLVRKIAENYSLPYYTLSPTYSVCKEHGYLQGEQNKCPICGNRTEVYSRITGYYRPVRNWNDGKSQEYKERKVYDIANSVLKKKSDKVVCEEETVKSEEILLFTTKTCPNCRAAKQMLDKAGINYKVIDAEENADLSVKYGVQQAPTIVSPFGVFAGIGNVKQFIAAAKKGA